MDAKAVVAVLDGLLAERENPGFIRPDNGPEFIVGVLENWCEEVKVPLYFIEPVSPWLNGRIES
jgi:putative transposase